MFVLSHSSHATTSVQSDLAKGRIADLQLRMDSSDLDPTDNMIPLSHMSQPQTAF